MSSDHKSIKSNRSGRQAARQLAKANAPTEPIVLATHTPGPWRIVSKMGASDYDYSLVGGNGGAAIATIRHLSLSADRLLIAAAPEMLEALRDILTASEHEPELYASFREPAIRAIARATGGAL